MLWNDEIFVALFIIILLKWTPTQLTQMTYNETSSEEEEKMKKKKKKNIYSYI